jgi:hypothetical protein
MASEPIRAQLLPADSPRRGCLPIAAITCGRWFVHFLVAALLFLQASSLLTAMDFYVHENLKIPPGTVAAWNWAHWVSSFGLVVFPVLLLLDVGILAGLECLPSAARWLVRVWFSFVLVSIMIIMTFSTFATVFPLKMLTESTAPKEEPPATIEP